MGWMGSYLARRLLRSIDKRASKKNRSLLRLGYPVVVIMRDHGNLGVATRALVEGKGYALGTQMANEVKEACRYLGWHWKIYRGNSDELMDVGP